MTQSMTMDDIRSNLASWETGGRERLGTVFTEIQTESLNDQSVNSSESLSFQAFLITLFECCIQTPSQPINPDHIIALLVACLDCGKDSASKSQQALAAAIWIIWTRLDSEADKAAVAQVVKTLTLSPAAAPVLPPKLVKELLHEDLIEAVGMWESAKLVAATRRIRTAEFYRQNKFNLFHEESEGFAKLIELVFSAFDRSPCMKSDKVKERIRALIGYFDLDPNRVIDVLVSVYASVARADTIDEFVLILSEYPAEHIAQITGFKFQQFNQPANQPKDEFVRLIALLISKNQLTIEAIWPHLSPSDADLSSKQVDWLKSENERISRIGAVSLVSDDKEADGDASMSQSKEVVLSEFSQSRNDAPIVMAEPVATVDPIVYLTQLIELPKHSCSKLVSHKFALLAALIDCDDWSHAEAVIKYLSAVDPTNHPLVSAALCRAIDRKIAPFYDEVSANNLYRIFEKDQSKPLKPHSAKQDLPSKFEDSTWLALPSLLHPVAEKLKHNLSSDVSVFARLCRVLERISKISVSTITPADNLSSFSLPAHMESIICQCIMPSYSLLPSSSMHSLSVWSILGPLPYTVRYRVYGAWRSLLENPASDLSMVAINKHIIAQTKYFRKRIAAAQVKECSRLLLKFALAAPPIVFSLILAQVAQFDNMIAPVCDSLRYLPMFALDCLSFSLVTSMFERSDKLKDDGLNEAHWFQSLCSFAGHLWRRMPDTDMSPLIQSVLNSLKSGDTVPILVLKSLMNSLTGIESHEEMSEGVLHGKSASRTVSRESSNVRGLLGPVALKQRDRASKALIDAFTKSGFLFPTYCLLTTSKDFLAFESEYDEPRLIGELVDKLSEVGLSFIEMIDVFCTADAEYARWFPSLKDCVSKYSLSLPDTFHALRRVLHLPRIQTNDVYKAQTESNNQSVTQKVGYAPLRHTLSLLLPPAVQQHLPLDLYSCFWRLSLYHLHVPTEVYSQTVKRLKAHIGSVDRLEGEWANTQDGPRRREKDRLNRLIKQIDDELTKHESDRASITNSLKREKDSWLTNATRDFFSLFASECLVPRALLSPVDAVYSATFLRNLVTIGTPRFSITLCADSVIGLVGPMIASSTACEASRFGRFLSLLLLQLSEYMSMSPRVFAEQAQRLPAFAAKVTEPNGPRYTFIQFKMCFDRWQRKLLSAFTNALQSEDKHETGNALLVCVKVASTFPRYAQHGQSINQLIQSIIEQQPKEGSSLKVLATRAHALLMTHKKNWITDEKTSEKTNTPSANQSSRSQPNSQSVNQSQPRENGQQIGQVNQPAKQSLNNDRSRPRDSRNDRNNQPITQSVTRIKPDPINQSASQPVTRIKADSAQASQSVTRIKAESAQVVVHLPQQTITPSSMTQSVGQPTQAIKSSSLGQPASPVIKSSTITQPINQSINQTKDQSPESKRSSERDRPTRTAQSINQADQSVTQSNNQSANQSRRDNRDNRGPRDRRNQPIKTEDDRDRDQSINPSVNQSINDRGPKRKREDDTHASPSPPHQPINQSVNQSREPHHTKRHRRDEPSMDHRANQSINDRPNDRTNQSVSDRSNNQSVDDRPVNDRSANQSINDRSVPRPHWSERNEGFEQRFQNQPSSRHQQQPYNRQQRR